jgi:Raf kinase inhibitor-like YbhB/YbcL family protein
MRIISKAFKDGELIPQKYTCDGENRSPPLIFEDVPKGAKSLVLIVEDPDAPAGTWDHWILFNIPPNVKEIREGEEPAFAHGRNSWGKQNWGGPCPPDRQHTYIFKLFALDTILSLKPGSDKSSILKAMSGHILAKAELHGKYKRPWM